MILQKVFGGLKKLTIRSHPVRMGDSPCSNLHSAGRAIQAQRGGIMEHRGVGCVWGQDAFFQIVLNIFLNVDHRFNSSLLHRSTSLK